MKAELGAVPCVLSNIELIVGRVLVPFLAFVPKGPFVLLYLFVYCIVDCERESRSVQMPVNDK